MSSTVSSGSRQSSHSGSGGSRKIIYSPSPPPAKSPGASPFYFLSRPTPGQELKQVGTKSSTTTEEEGRVYVAAAATGGSDSNPSTSLGTPSDNEYNSSLTTESGFSDPIPSRPVFQNLPQIINDDETTSRTTNKRSSSGLKLLAGFFGGGRPPRHHENEKVPLLAQNVMYTTNSNANANNNISNGSSPSTSEGQTRAVSFLHVSTPDGGVKPVEIPLRLIKKRQITIEPKVPLANERTLLAWFHWATLLAGASLALSSFHTVEKHPMQQVGGLLLLPFSVIVIVYALNQYMTRAYLIDHGVSGGIFYDATGPIVLGLAMLVCLCTSFIMKLEEAH